MLPPLNMDNPRGGTPGSDDRRSSNGALRLTVGRGNRGFPLVLIDTSVDNHGASLNKIGKEMGAIA